MKQIGSVRRIDNLGRIVLPKEIRKALRIQNGDSLEISLNEEYVVLKKHSQMNNLNDITKALTKSINGMIITSNDKIMTGKYINEKISNDLIDILNKRKDVYGDNIKITNTDTLKGSYYISPIIVSGDTAGLVILVKENIEEEDKKIARIISNFLSMYIE